MATYQEYHQFNGSVLVAEKGDVIFKKGYGFANMEWEIANSPDTKFRLGSITKQFTSMLIMQLVQKGKIQLNNKLFDYLPEYRPEGYWREGFGTSLIDTYIRNTELYWTAWIF